MARPEAITDLLQSADAEGRDQLTTDEVYRLLGYGDDFQPGTGAAGAGIAAGIRCLRDFGMVIEAGIGGEDEEIYTGALRRGQSGAAAVTGLTDAGEFLELFRATAGYRRLARRAGDRVPVLDSALQACFRQLLQIANAFSPEHPDTPWIIEELILNPLTFANQRLLPGDCRCRFTRPATIRAVRPIEKIDKLLHPQSIGIIGVSAGKMNFGRIILNNIVTSGYDPDRLRIIRPGETEIDGVPCVGSLKALGAKLDLLIMAVGADAVFTIVDDIIRTDAAESVMLIPGGLGETQNSREPAAAMIEKINAAHQQAGGGPVFLGGNCLGIISRPGNYDSWFVPAERLPRPHIKQRRNTVLISQSGAFMVTRISKHPWLDPAYMIADGNQNDISHSDLLRYFNTRDEIEVIGFYIEGFRDLDGVVFTRAVREAVLNGKQIIVYKAGHTESGRQAAIGHTASIAGDYLLFETLLLQAGAIVAKDLSEFTDLMYVADCLHHKHIGGNRLGTISGAGFEAVTMADSIEVDGFSMEMAKLEPATVTRLEEILTAKGLDALMEVRNPIDINPAADDDTHLQCTVAFVEDPNVDVVVSSMDPISPRVMSTEHSGRKGFDMHNQNSQVNTFPGLVREADKPIIGVVDGGTLYDPMAVELMNRGVCIFRSCERAVHALVRYVEARLRTAAIRRRG
jgi:acyl-CoA synthetase (NDP forming)